MLRILWVGLLVVATLAPSVPARADEAAAKALITKVIDRAGGEPRLLKHYRFRERVLIQDKPADPPGPDEKGNREATIEVGGRMWLGTKRREKDKVRVLIWAWSLRILLEPGAKVDTLDDAMVAGKAAVGLRVTTITKDPIDLWFEKESLRLLAIDYTDTRHVFSDWTTTADGYEYPKHVAGYRFADAAKKIAKDTQWYQTDILDLKPLQELPAGLE
jgi:hypothetical protein